MKDIQDYVDELEEDISYLKAQIVEKENRLKDIGDHKVVDLEHLGSELDDLIGQSEELIDHDADGEITVSDELDPEEVGSDAMDIQSQLEDYMRQAKDLM